MCGIAGFVNFLGHDRSEAAERVRRMTDVLVHRGPDAKGVYVDDRAALGHRRLSIIDLRGGQQPMGVLDGRVQIVFNGEVYNFRELRTHLETVGHRFHTSSDTEVILRGYLEWGTDCLPRLNGMFAFAIWDARTHRLFLARDRVGKKPLYYFQTGGQIAFASELKALRAGNLVADEIDVQALDCYFSFGYVPAPMSIYKSVKKLPAASYKSVSPAGAEQGRYWDLSFADVVERDLDEAAEELESLLDEAVRCRLMSEVPLGAFLSGGLDSTLVVASMARALDTPVVSNSIGFDAAGFNELPVARLVAEQLQTRHHELVVRPDVEGVIRKIAWHLDEPFADSSAVPTWYVCEMAKANVTVALSGDGGDEGFGGYTFRYLPHATEAKLRASLPIWLRGPLFSALGWLWPGSTRLPKPLRLKTILENLAISDAEAFCRDLAWVRSDVRKRLYSEDFKASLLGFTPAETVLPLYSGSDGRDALARSQYTDINFYMSDDVLVKVDRMSMAHSLEVRSPLLDFRILEFASRLPMRLKLNVHQGKLVLRELAKRRLPSQVAGARKAGFSMPVSEWLRGGLSDLAQDHIFRENGIVSSYLNPREVRNLWNEHGTGARDHSVLLWGLLMIGLWDEEARRVA
jgi:asparagine synthase (glutamine-hydrolysing)